MNAWELIIQQPVINVLIVMSHYLANNFGMAIIALTVVVNICMYPLTLKQIRSSKAMQDMQPKIAELQKKYGKDKQKMAQEQMRMYKESGVKPAGCFITMIIQMPVWIALYQSIMLALAVAPEGLLNLSKYLYQWPIVFSVLPLDKNFLMLDLAQPNFILAILVGVTMWLQQKMSMAVSSDPKQRQQSQMMLWMMPMMFALLALSFPSGLSLYWVANSVVRVVLQYRVTGWGGLRRTPTEATGDSEKKYVKFDASEEGRSVDDVGADIVITDSDTTRKDIYHPSKPSKTRYRPDQDRAQRRRKK
ncbi:MAG: membrane protein insertase YidC [Dehalococcoidales bacterium]|nr:membrane protein insertase YidC [Dehalococcoidales bacterium]